MADTTTVDFALRSLAREGDEDWEAIEPDHIAVWSKASELLAFRSYEHESCRAVVRINWTPLVQRLSHLHDLRRTAHLTRSLASFDWSPFWEKMTVQASVSLSGENRLSQYDWYPSFFAELYAYDVFTILNLAYPGSCNFFSLTISTKAGRVTHEPRLAGSAFDFAWVESRSGRWLSLKSLPLEEVLKWHSSLGLGTKQKAKTAVEKALFALLHLCRREDYSDTVIWIFYALEALVQTKVGESVSGLVRRLALLLSLDEPQKANLNRLLRELYDFRSAIVHGGYQVTHPIAQEVVDRRLEDEYGRFFRLYQFGFTLIVACLQSLVLKQWVDIEFLETMRGTDAAL